nr:class I tRNA ligase family protein [Piscinibacter sp.]
VHGVLRQVSYDYERMQYNTVVSGAMKLLNALESFKGSDAPAVVAEAYSILLRVLYPACPHVTDALWRQLGYAGAMGDILDAPWPVVEEAALARDEVELVLQVNGKLRGSLTVPAAADRAAIEQAALASPEVQRFADGQAIRRVVVVPGRLVNVVL